MFIIEAIREGHPSDEVKTLLQQDPLVVIFAPSGRSLFGGAVTHHQRKHLHCLLHTVRGLSRERTTGFSCVRAAALLRTAQARAQQLGPDWASFVKDLDGAAERMEQAALHDRRQFWEKLAWFCAGSISLISAAGTRVYGPMFFFMF